MDIAGSAMIAAAPVIAPAVNAITPIAAAFAPTAVKMIGASGAVMANTMLPGSGFAVSTVANLASTKADDVVLAVLPKAGEKAGNLVGRLGNKLKRKASLSTGAAPAA